MTPTPAPSRAPAPARSRHRRVLAAALALGSCGPLLAQFQGNGIGAAFLSHTAARVGGTIDFEFGSPLAANGIAVLGISDVLAASVHPIVGPVGLDLNAMFQSEGFVLDANGEIAPSLTIPNLPALVQLPPVFAQLAVFEAPGQISVSKATRVTWELPDGYTPAGSLGTARAAHTATALGADARDDETRVFVTGGGGGTLLVPQATASTELYDPLTRTTTPGPAMAVARALHTAVRLPDGRVLVCGGTDSAGNVTNHAEIFDPATNAFVATAAMQQPRVGHQATLLGNGLVLVTGGLANYTNPLANLIAVLNTAQATAEVFDPAAGTWTQLAATMTNPRSGHLHTLLGDGRVLISGGIQGGQLNPLNLQIPVYSATCDLFDPATSQFAPTGSLLTARAFHGASVLANGDVLVTGGSVVTILFGLVSATDSCERWNGSVWTAVNQLPAGLTNPAQVRAADGSALVLGGLTGTFPTLVGADLAGRHDGTAFTPGAALGTNPGLGVAVSSPRGAMVPVPLFDGTILLVGGTDGATPLANLFVYQP